MLKGHGYVMEPAGQNAYQCHTEKDINLTCPIKGILLDSHAQLPCGVVGEVFIFFTQEKVETPATSYSDTSRLKVIQTGAEFRNNLY